MRRRRRATNVRAVIHQADASLLEVIDHVLTKGVVVTGDVVLASPMST
ncbi:MAG: gas vesicle protein GvpJ [Candidatus Rokuibacteriota bacterium]